MSASGPIDVLGIGNAIVDVLARTTDPELASLGLTKGVMTLIDADRAQDLYGRMGPAQEMSGGSVANSIAGLASFGGSAAFIGKVRDDQLGEIFRHDIRAIGVRYGTDPAVSGPPTARCLIFVTPDAQRTMQTFLGVSTELGPADIDRATVEAASVTYMEGYLFDRPEAKAAFRRAAELAHAAGRRVALSLSDPFCVERHRDEFRELVAGHVDVLFANEAEVTALYQVEDFDAALQAVRGDCGIAALTRSEKGSVVVAGDSVHAVPAAPVAEVVDTTGAGDLYAAGFLYGLTQGRDLAACGRLGSLAAAEIISHMGARPEVSLAELAARA